MIAACPSRSLDPRSFTFHGFGDELAQIERGIARLHLRCEPPTVRIVEDGVFVPPLRVSRISTAEDPGKFQAGITDRDGVIVEGTVHRRAGRKYFAGLPVPFQIEPAESLDEEVVYLGWIMGHYGHFLLESLARTWILEDLDPSVKALFHSVGEERNRGWVRQILETFGIPPARILSPDVPTRIRRVIVPEPLYELSYAAHERAAEAYRAAATGIIGARDALPSGQPVYLSRRLLPSQNRQIVGEDVLEAVFRENGFLIAHPQTMPFTHQAWLFNQHRDIFTTDGSAAYTVLFALGQPRLHLLTAGCSVPDYYLAPTVAGAPTSFIKCLGANGHLATEGKVPQLVDIGAIGDYLVERGFLAHRKLPSLAHESSRLRDRYDRELFSVRVGMARKRARRLRAEEEQEALRLAVSSWSLSWTLARYFAIHDPSRVDVLIRQFADLVAAETNIDRLAAFQPQILRTFVGLLRRCDPATRCIVAPVLVDCFDVTVPPKLIRQCNAVDVDVLRPARSVRVHIEPHQETGKMTVTLGLGNSRLEPSSFVFHGYGDERVELERTVRRMEVSRGEPGVLTVEDGILVPPGGDTSRPLKGRGGVVTAGGKVVEVASSRRDRPPAELVTVAAENEVDEDVVYLGPLHEHYGHFLLESLTRTWFLNEVDSATRVAFHHSGPPDAVVHGSILEAFGITPQRMLSFDVPTRVRRILVPERMYRISRSAHEQAGAAYRKAAERIVGSQSLTQYDQPVYLSRRLLPADRRAIIGEEELEEALRENGWLIVYPETMEFADQVRLFNQHANIVAAEGSAAHTVLFSMTRPQMHLLTSGVSDAPALADSFLVSAVAGSMANFVNCLGHGGRAMPDHQSRRLPQLLDFDSLVAYLTDCGLLERTPRTALASRDTLRREQFDEAWLASRLRTAFIRGDSLADADLQHAVALVHSSWPLCALLARYYAARDPAKVDAFLRQFSTLAAAETQIDRLARFRDDIAGMLGVTAMLNAASTVTLDQLRLTVADCFDIREHDGAAQQRAAEMTATAPDDKVGDDTAAVAEGRSGEPQCPAHSVLIAGLDRAELVTFLPKGGVVAEVGVFRGAFAARILRSAPPKTLHLIDPWDPASESGPGEGAALPAAYEQVMGRFESEIAAGRVVVHRDYSSQAAQAFPDHAFDWIYVDAMHDYRNVLADLQAYAAKIKPDGFILGHDFSGKASSRAGRVGVIAAVRDFVHEGDFELALVTNEVHATYLLRRTGNTTTWPALREAILNRFSRSSIEVDEALFDGFEIVSVTSNDGAAAQIFRIGSHAAIGDCNSS